jgi:hypothetical protein
MTIKKKVCCFSLVIIALLLIVLPVSASVKYQLKETLAYNDISGNIESSFLDPGLELRQDFSLRAMGVNEDGWKYRASLSLRNVIDFENNDYGNINLRNYRLNLIKNQHDISLGRVYADYGQYLMVQNMTGLTYFNRDWDFSVSAGRVRPYSEGKSLERNAFGLSKEFEANNPLSDLPGIDKLLFSTGLSLVKDSPHDSETIEAEESRVVSAELNAGLSPNLNLQTMVAGSEYLQDVNLDANTGIALKSELLYQIPGLRLTGGFERVSPEFENLSSPLSSDRIEFFSRARISLSERLRLDTGYRTYQDNLDNEKERTTKNQLFNISFNQRYQEDRNKELQYGFKGRIVTNDDNTVSTQNITGDVQYRGRHEDLDYRLNFDYNWINNLLNPFANRNRYATAIDLKGSYYLRDKAVSPFFNYMIESDAPITGAADMTYTANLGSSLRIDYDNNINARIRYISHDKSDDADDSQKTTIAFAYNRNIPGYEAGLEISAEVTNNTFVDQSENYQETVLKTAFTKKF